MTFSYSYRVTSVRLFGLARLLTIWRASVYKLVFLELLIHCLLYASGSCVYRFALSQAQKKLFEKVVVYCGTFESILPVTFVLGFYVSVVVQRWWSQFMNIPWPDRMMSYISVLIPGLDEATVMLRRTIIRYLLLSEVLLLMAVSAPIKKRFPDVESLVQQGLMTKQEYDLYNDEKVPHISSKYWLPTHWCAMLFGRARREKKIKDNFSLTVLLNELSTYKSCLGTVFTYDWISLPLVYTQVATISVYGFFINTVLSRQYLNHTSVRAEFGPEVSAKYAIDLYVPIDTLLQLFFYLGWLKVAEQMLNPFGEDDDDFECNFIVDRNLKVGLYAVDGMLRREPPLQRDVWWQSEDPQLFYTEASEKFAMSDGWFGSVANIAVPSISTTEVTASRVNLLPGIPEVSPAGTADHGNDDNDDAEEDEDNDEEETGSRAGHRLSLLSRSMSQGVPAVDCESASSATATAEGRRLPPLLQELKKPAGKRGDRRRTRTTAVDHRRLSQQLQQQQQPQSPHKAVSESEPQTSPGAASELCHSLPDSQFRFGRKDPDAVDGSASRPSRLPEIAEQSPTRHQRPRRTKQPVVEVEMTETKELSPLLQTQPAEQACNPSRVVDSIAEGDSSASALSSRDSDLDAAGQAGQASSDRPDQLL